MQMDHIYAALITGGVTLFGLFAQGVYFSKRLAKQTAALKTAGDKSMKKLEDDTAVR